MLHAGVNQLDRTDRAERLTSGPHTGQADLSGRLVDAPLVLDRIEESQLPCHENSLPRGCDSQSCSAVVRCHRVRRGLKVVMCNVTNPHNHLVTALHFQNMGPDPSEGVGKVLTVTYTVDGGDPLEATFEEANPEDGRVAIVPPLA